MKIVIDAHMLGEQEGGNETYIAGLLQGLADSFLSRGTTITSLYNPYYVAPQREHRQLRSLHLGSLNNFRRLFLEIPALCRQLRADLVHMTYNASPLSSCPLVLSVHDVIFRRFPQYFSPRVRVLLRMLLPLSMRHARVIITLSEASKRDLVNFYPFVRDKVVVTPLAAGPMVGAEPNFAAAEDFSQHQDFILAVGTLQPRKNIVRLVQAYIDARQQGQTHARLVVVGRAAWQYSGVYRLAAESPYSEEIVFTGYLDDATVAALYRTCTVFVYPSLYEGFGLPVLEAMALGAPVITSNLSSMPEVAGDAAMLVDPYSVDQLSAAIARVSSNIGVREELRQRGLRRAASFSWKHTAQQTLEIYRWALRTRRNP